MCPHALHAGGGIKTIVAKRICIEPYRSFIIGKGRGGKVVATNHTWFLLNFFHNCHQIIPTLASSYCSLHASIDTIRSLPIEETIEVGKM